jgi:small subunit ribosomal protein S20
VAHSISAKKRVRQNLKGRARNRYRKEQLKENVKEFNAAMTAGDWKKAQEALNKTVQRMDRISTKGTIHRNTASRKRSRLAKRLNAARAAGTAGGGAGKGSKTV